MKTKYIVANWKLNPPTPREAKSLFIKLKKYSTGLKRSKIVICPPNPFLGLFDTKTGKTLSLGGQDCQVVDFGAFTGAVNPALLKYSGCSYVILGHSEVRERGDSNEMINEKVKASLKAGLKVILCVGEKKRDSQGLYLEELRLQLTEGLSRINKKDFSKIIIAYEPVWAIGVAAKSVDTPENFLHNALFIKKIIAKLAGKETALKIPILYGGSVNEKNALGFLSLGEANGLLIGRTSLDGEKFGQIVKIAESVK